MQHITKDTKMLTPRPLKLWDTIHIPTAFRNCKTKKETTAQGFLFMMNIANAMNITLAEMLYKPIQGLSKPIHTAVNVLMIFMA